MENETDFQSHFLKCTYENVKGRFEMFSNLYEIKIPSWQFIRQGLTKCRSDTIRS